MFGSIHNKITSMVVFKISYPFNTYYIPNFRNSPKPQFALPKYFRIFWARRITTIRRINICSAKGYFIYPAWP